MRVGEESMRRIPQEQWTPADVANWLYLHDRPLHAKAMLADGVTGAVLQVDNCVTV